MDLDHLTDKKVAEVLARDYKYKHGMKQAQREEMAARAAESEERWQEGNNAPAQVTQESPVITPQTGEESPQDEKPINCPTDGQNAVEREIFDLDEQTCIEFLKSRGWQF